MRRLLSRAWATALVGTSLANEPGYESLRTDLLGGDPKQVEAAASGLAKIDSKKIVRDLMEIVMSEDVEVYWKPKVYEGDMLVVEPIVTAMRTLSELVPDPPITYRSKVAKGDHGFIDDLAQWQRWWIRNREFYEADDGEIPPPGRGSLRLLSDQEAEFAEKEFLERSYQLEQKLWQQELASLKEGERIPKWENYLNHLSQVREEEKMKLAAGNRTAAPGSHDPKSPPPSSNGSNAKGPKPTNDGTPSLLIVIGVIAILGIAGILVRSRLS